MSRKCQNCPASSFDALAWEGPPSGTLDWRMEWTGPLPIPPALWPYGPPSAHESCCTLFSGGRFCDCAASDESDGMHGKMTW